MKFKAALLAVGVLAAAVVAAGCAGDSPADERRALEPPPVLEGESPVVGENPREAPLAPTPELLVSTVALCGGSAPGVEPCRPRDVSTFSLFASVPGGSVPGGVTASEPEAVSVEAVLESGLRLAESSPVHLVFRGTAASDSVRCEWRGVARTAAQREASIRYWLGLDDTIVLPASEAIERLFIAILERAEPSYPESARASFRTLAQGGLSTD